ncbi:MAG TPA: M56 family metallopeptidase [Bryobacteraceae bacterium]|nr:M56 family metallopeptidase [Bryobacteraceae bacterium]
MPTFFAANLWSWMEQTFLIATLGAVLPVVLRLRHPRTQLIYHHALLVVCLLLPLIEPWRHTMIKAAVPATTQNVVVTPGRKNQAAIEAPSQARPAQQPSISQGPRPAVWDRVEWSPIIFWGLMAGAGIRLCWLLVGVWKTRNHRIAAMPLYPIPESIQAASAITHADALFCVSAEATGPVMLGWLAPVVLLPESFLTLSDEAQCGIACHELVHVRRHDWLITLLEEFAAAIFWFNPIVWLLLARTRLLREQVVDAEAVQLTEAKDSYIEALLAIARRGVVPDLVMAPLFLRRRHLTQRVQALIKDYSMSRVRLLCSYASIAPMLAVAGWVAFLLFPLVGPPRVEAYTPPPQTRSEAAALVVVPQPSAPSPLGVPQRQQSEVAPPERTDEPRTTRVDPHTGAVDSFPVPADVHEPVTSGFRVPETADERAAALAVIERALQNSRMHVAEMKGYNLKVSFNAGGNVAHTGAGELTETWFSGQNWRWTANLGNFSIVRIASQGQVVDEAHVANIPMRVQMLREAIFWAAGFGVPSNAALRTAAVRLNGRPATCVLTSRMNGAVSSTRLWEEEESCVDDGTGLMQVYSWAPGSYVVYGYGRNLNFHGTSIPDQIAVYVGGVLALDAQVDIMEAGPMDPGLLRVTPEMLAGKPSVVLQKGSRFAVNVSDDTLGGQVRPVIVHATITTSGDVTDAEVTAASDSALVGRALEYVKTHNFGFAGVNQRDAYINIRFGASAR